MTKNYYEIQVAQIEHEKTMFLLHLTRTQKVELLLHLELHLTDSKRISFESLLYFRPEYHGISYIVSNLALSTVIISST